MMETALADPPIVESPLIHFVPRWRGRRPGQDSSVQRMLVIFQAHAAMEAVAYAFKHGLLHRSRP